MSLQTRLEALAAAIGADIKKMVRVDTNQTINGVKTFGSTPVVPDNSFPVSKLSATGVKSNLMFLRADNVWAAPVGNIQLTRQIRNPYDQFMWSMEPPFVRPTDSLMPTTDILYQPKTFVERTRILGWAVYGLSGTATGTNAARAYFGLYGLDSTNGPGAALHRTPDSGVVVDNFQRFYGVPSGLNVVVDPGHYWVALRMKAFNLGGTLRHHTTNHPGMQHFYDPMTGFPGGNSPNIISAYSEPQGSIVGLPATAGALAGGVISAFMYWLLTEPA